MDEKSRMAMVASRLEACYPASACSLNGGGNAYRMLVQAILSAQCTDKRVNEVSAAFFGRFPDAEALAQGKVEEIEGCIRSCGLYRAKAKNLSLTAKRLTGVYGGRVPSEMRDLLTLPGVGRKVANLIRGDVFGLGGIVADTHCIRIAGRLGFSDGKDPVKTERALTPLLETEKQSAFCHRLVDHGRAVCTARAPKCGECVLNDLCDYAARASESKKEGGAVSG